MIRKEFGKIQSVSFGHGGYQDCRLGIWFSFEGKSWGVCDGRGFWDAEIIKHEKSCQWSEGSRDKAYSDVMRYLSKLLREANVSNVNKLKGKPVEVQFEGNTIKSWRLLTEVM